MLTAPLPKLEISYANYPYQAVKATTDYHDLMQRIMVFDAHARTQPFLQFIQWMNQYYGSDLDNPLWEMLMAIAKGWVANSETLQPYLERFAQYCIAGFLEEQPEFRVNGENGHE